MEWLLIERLVSSATGTNHSLFLVTYQHHDCLPACLSVYLLQMQVDLIRKTCLVCHLSEERQETICPHTVQLTRCASYTSWIFTSRYKMIYSTLHSTHLQYIKLFRLHYPSTTQTDFFLKFGRLTWATLSRWFSEKDWNESGLCSP